MDDAAMLAVVQGMTEANLANTSATRHAWKRGRMRRSACDDRAIAHFGDEDQVEIGEPGTGEYAVDRLTCRIGPYASSIESAIQPGTRRMIGISDRSTGA